MCTDPVITMKPVVIHMSCFVLSWTFCPSFPSSVRPLSSISDAFVARPQAGLDPRPEIMVPVVSTAKELRLIVPRIKAAIADELEKAGVEVSGRVSAVSFRLPPLRVCRVKLLRLGDR